MRAVAPQIISPETSKNHTGKESSSLPGIVAPGDPPALLVEDRRVGQLGQRDVEDPLHLARAGHQVRPRRQRGEHRHDQRGRHHGQDRVEPADDRDQARVEADLLVRLAQRAAAAGSSPSSSRPPGKLTSPRCVRRPDERRVRISRASPASSKSAASTAGVDLAHRRRVGLVDQRGRPEDASRPMSSGTGPRWPRGPSASRTRSRPIAVRAAPPGRRPRARGAPGRQVGGRGITWGGPGGTSASR